MVLRHAKALSCPRALRRLDDVLPRADDEDRLLEEVQLPAEGAGQIDDAEPAVLPDLPLLAPALDVVVHRHREPPELRDLRHPVDVGVTAGDAAIGAVADVNCV